MLQVRLHVSTGAQREIGLGGHVADICDWIPSEGGHVAHCKGMAPGALKLNL
jgi:hypothetical protein